MWEHNASSPTHKEVDGVQWQNSNPDLQSKSDNFKTSRSVDLKVPHAKIC